MYYSMADNFQILFHPSSIVSQWRVFLVTDSCDNLDEAMLMFCHVVSLSALSRGQRSTELTWRTEWQKGVLNAVQVRTIILISHHLNQLGKLYFFQSCHVKNDLKDFLPKAMLLLI